MDMNALLLKPRLRPDQLNRLIVLFKKSFGQWRALIRQARLLTDQMNPMTLTQFGQ
jgi:hypothetical protein